MLSERSRNRRLIEEPYRLFFPLAIVFGLAGVGHWLFYAAGFQDHYSGMLHASVQMQAYMICFIVGFLMTMMPRMSGKAFANAFEVLGMGFCVLGLCAAACLGQWIWVQLFFVAALLGLLLFGGRRALGPRSEQAPKADPPVELVWIPIALLHGLLGAIFLMLGTLAYLGPWSALVGKAMVQQGFVLSIVLGIGGFMAPRLMGTFKRTLYRGRDARWHALAGLVLWITFFLEGLGWVRTAYGVRALLVTALLVWTRSLVQKPVMTEQYVRLLWLSFWMVGAGTWAAFLWPAYRVAMLHFVFIGGYTLMTFAVATMVFTTHAGRKAQLREPSGVLTFLGVTIGLALLARVASVFLPDVYFPLLGIASVLWILGACVWAIQYVPLALVFPDPDEVMRMHETAKQEVLRRQAGSSRIKRTQAC